MDVRLPDGTIVTNVPDNITQSELARRLGKKSWLAGGRDPVVSAAEAGTIAAGRSASQMIEGGKQIGMELSGDESGLAEQKAQQAEAERLYAPLAKEFPIATAIGGATPYLAVPMGAPGAVGRVAIPALTVALGEAMKYGTPAERGARGAVGLAGGLGGGAISEIARKVIFPLANQVPSASQTTIKELAAKVGAKPLPSQLINSPTLARYEDTLARMPGSAGVMGDFVQSNRDAIARKATEAIGETAPAPTGDVLAAAKERLGGQFDLARKSAALPSDASVFDAIDNANKLLSRGDPTAGGKSRAREMLSTLKDKLYGTKSLSGDEYRAWISDLKGYARETKNETVSMAVRDVVKAMDDAATGLDKAAMAETNKQYAALKTLLKSQVIPNEATGEVNPAAVARAMAQQFRGKEKMGVVQGPLADIAAYGRGVPQLRMGSQTAEREAADSVLGILKMPVRYGAAKALTSPLLQAYLTRGLLGYPAASRAAAELGGRTAFPATAGLLEESFLRLLPFLPIAAEKN